VLEAVDGVDAIKVILENSDVKLMLVDYNMPRMDGFELVLNLRDKYDKTGLTIIGVSAEVNDTLSAKFIKLGANDFLRSPFHPEEFYCRVMHCVESLELMQRIAYYADRDYLTEIYHRAYFLKQARNLYEEAKNTSTLLTLAVINIDQFNEINIQHGSEWGDDALKFVSKHLNTMLDRFLFARAESDTFYLAMPGLDHERATALLNKVKQLLYADTYSINGEASNFSFSAGVTDKPFTNIDQQLTHATDYMRRAKDAGGGMIVDEDDEE
jgi:diguanylate cyclase (GGDEF)-like protein